MDSILSRTGACNSPGAVQAAKKLIYLAIVNAVPAWTRTRNWTTALLAFKIHFGDRLPD
jgi:transposase-like protein